MEKKLYSVAFVSNTLNHNNESEVNICVFIPSGMTEEQAMKLEEVYERIVEEWGIEHDEDYEGFSHHIAISNSFAEIGLEYEYPKPDYTISV